MHTLLPYFLTPATLLSQQAMKDDVVVLASNMVMIMIIRRKSRRYLIKSSLCEGVVGRCCEFKVVTYSQEVTGEFQDGCRHVIHRSAGRSYC